MQDWSMHEVQQIRNSQTVKNSHHPSVLLLCQVKPRDGRFWLVLVFHLHDASVTISHHGSAAVGHYVSLQDIQAFVRPTFSLCHLPSDCCDESLYVDRILKFHWFAAIAGLPQHGKLIINQMVYLIDIVVHTMHQFLRDIAWASLLPQKLRLQH